MSGIVIRKVEREDVEKLHWALTQLSKDIDDDHAADADDLLRHGFGEKPAFFALLAEERIDGAVVGALMASPLFSTTNAGAGLYVSDLWVAASKRGTGLGKRLLAAALETGTADWTVRFLELAVYRDNSKARAFYDRLGFSQFTDEIFLTLKGPALDNLRKTP
ncbi:ribosomal protein S18 acetylase RimI-like enzyme [Breoghania corrubedonensis]|uniref:Ribosomal protein S18 acetylase RimI-like enzyme n=1 Tax=Breoghania corrubedonensis TaxID=665038 RepID=A0A2T5V5J1_9HYPH|nr:GNAT family N-acetyltransferase [Breoghania corrubedonensis]PTW59014.1 ribosomal protein S18 acetylase RimI-like enzyme [Breoghania corrubedonensis]